MILIGRWREYILFGGGDGEMSTASEGVSSGMAGMALAKEWHRAATRRMMKCIVEGYWR